MAILNTFTPNTTAKASEVNQNFQNINAQINPEHNLDGTHSIIRPTATKQNYVSLPEVETYNIDGNLGNIFRIEPSAARGITFSNMSIGQAFMIRVKQGSGGSINWPSEVKWVDGVTPTLVATVGRTDVYGFLRTGESTYDGYIIGRNIP